MLVLLIPAENTFAADKLPYTISSPRIVKMRSNRVLLEWYQPLPYTIVVYKLSSTRDSFNNCNADIETFDKPFCKVVFTKREYQGNVRIIDSRYRKGDEYYIQRAHYKTMLDIYPTKTYGPFIPK